MTVTTTQIPTSEALADKLLEPHVVARRLNVTTNTVRRWCRDGRCQAVSVCGRWRVPESWVNDTMRTRRIEQEWQAPAPRPPEVVYRRDRNKRNAHDPG